MHRIRGTKVISKRGQHREETTAAICEGKDAELVEGGVCVGDGWKQPVGVVLVDTLREEGDDPKKLGHECQVV